MAKHIIKHQGKHIISFSEMIHTNKDGTTSFIDMKSDFNKHPLIEVLKRFKDKAGDNPEHFKLSYDDETFIITIKTPTGDLHTQPLFKREGVASYTLRRLFVFAPQRMLWKKIAEELPEQGFHIKDYYIRDDIRNAIKRINEKFESECGLRKLVKMSQNECWINEQYLS